ncbi:MAG: PAS domain-containing protein, partial [Elusimicrobia bacterium]|nr:PAS domain-containing protein [Elusimicrobiota bacterium]
MEDPSLQRQTELILESLGEGVHVLDADGVAVFENAASAALFGRAGGGLVGRLAHDLAHARREDGTDFPAELCPIHQTLRDGR